MVKEMSQANIEVKLSCKTLGVSSSGYYAFNKRPISLRSQRNDEMKTKIIQIHQSSRGTYGEPRVRAQLRAEGSSCGKHRVARLMKQAGLSGLNKRRFKIKTTDSNHNLPIAPRILQTENADTLPIRPNQVWTSDITYIHTEEGWLFLAIFLDLFTRKIVGHAMADHMRSELVLNALNVALLTQKPDGHQLTSHSDRGSQYASEAFAKRLALLKITASMSRTGNCYDNAYAESFFHSLKVEMIYRYKFKTRKEAMTAIFEYIEVWYNKTRLHSSIGYLSPIDYENIHLAA